MFKKLFKLQWQSFFRSANFGKSLGIKIFMGFMAVYLLVSLLFSGGGSYFLLKEAFPDQSPLWTLSQYLIYWVLIELVLRYFMQKLPVMDVKPLLAMPITKSNITHYILGRSGLSIYNVLALFFFVPFGIVLLFNGYSGLNVFLWLISLVAIVLTMNYVNLLINKNEKILIGLGVILVSGYLLDYFSIISIKEIFGPIFHALYAYPVAVLIPIALAAATYYINFKYLKSTIYLDDTLKSNVKEASTSDLAWTEKFGEIAPFLKLDLKLIWRNKRTKSQVFISLIMVFYGLIFYTQDMYSDSNTMKLFLGLFMTGIFPGNFGQFIPAWDSAYYSMMMSQNIPLRKYLDSKVGLLRVSVVVMFLLTIPYVYFGWDALAINFACAIYNLGVNIPVILYFGSFNKKRIELDQSPFGNMQGTSATQFLIMLPVFVVPVIIFSLLNYFVSFYVAIGTLIVLGVIGFALRNYLTAKITEQYRSKKHQMIAGFKQKS